MKERKIIAELKAEAAKQGLSENKLANKAGITQPTINRTFNQLFDTKISVLESIAAALGGSISFKPNKSKQK
jgi:predicted transcriptional regulator